MCGLESQFLSKSHCAGTSPDDASVFVTRCRKRRADKACDEAPHRQGG